MDKQALLDQLKRDEGLRLKPYKCTAGKLTIGFGRNLEDVGISEQEAELMLMEDIRNVAIELADNRIYEKLDDARQTVLANMAFNLGMSRLGKFKKMWAALSRQDYQKAADEMMDSRWARQVGVRAKRLEAIMRTGEL